MNSTPFFIYENATGRILRCGHCDRAAFDSQAGAGQTVVAGLANEMDHRWDLVNDELVTLTDLTESSPAPSGGTWTYDPTSLPSGTVVQIQQPDGRIRIHDASASIGPFSAGVYGLRLIPPLPFKELFREVVVA